MARPLDLIGRKFGKLTVLESTGHGTYGGKRGLLWRCRCDCGEEITLPIARLPTTERKVRNAERAKTLLYTSCESCRQKTCRICGDKFNFSHLSDICPKESCRDEAKRERDDFWIAKYMDRYRSDPEVRKRQRERQRDWRVDNEEEERLRNERRYEELKADPERYAEYLAQRRKQKSEKALLEFFETAQELMGIHNDKE